jgi:hypothetical protein
VMDIVYLLTIFAFFAATAGFGKLCEHLGR